MKNSIYGFVVVAILAGGALSVPSNVTPLKQYAWGENVGWLNWRDANGQADGVHVGETFLEGWIWGENIGWIHVGGGGGPYANTNDTNFGVNRDDVTGELSGLAWAENIGWINFGGGALATPAQPAEFDITAQRFRGYAWSANAGWINLDDGTHFVGTLVDADRDMDGDVDGVDFAVFASCFNKAGNPPRTLGCDPEDQSALDFDDDGDVDGVDFSKFASCFNKAGNLPRTLGCPEI